MNKFVFFKSKTCGPCRMVTPILEEIKNENSLNVETIFVDTDEGMEKAQELGVRSVPTIIKTNEFGELEVSIGFKTKEHLQAWMLA